MGLDIKIVGGLLGLDLEKEQQKKTDSGAVPPPPNSVLWIRSISETPYLKSSVHTKTETFIRRHITTSYPKFILAKNDFKKSLFSYFINGGFQGNVITVL